MTTKLSTIDLSTIDWTDINKVVAAAPDIIKALQAGQTTQQIVSDLEPATLMAIEMVANLLVPGLGSAIAVLDAVVVLISKYAHPMTPAEQEAWFKRVQGEH